LRNSYQQQRQRLPELSTPAAQAVDIEHVPVAAVVASLCARGQGSGGFRRLIR
jgi:hypothetical protein